MVAKLLAKGANPNTPIAAKTTGPTSPRQPAPTGNTPPLPPPRVVPANLQRTMVGDTALHIAIDAAGSAAVVKALLASPTTNADAPNGRGRTPAYKAVKRANRACWEALLGAKAAGRVDLNRGRVIFAAIQVDPAWVERVVRAGAHADGSWRNERGQSPLEFAVYRCWAPMWPSRADVIRALTRHGARVTHAMLRYAQQSNWSRVVEALEAALARQGPEPEPPEPQMVEVFSGARREPAAARGAWGGGQDGSRGYGSSSNGGRNGGGGGGGGGGRANYPPPGKSGNFLSSVVYWLLPLEPICTEQIIGVISNCHPCAFILMLPVFMPLLIMGMYIDFIVMVLRLISLTMLAVLAVPPAARTAWDLASWVLAAWRRWASSSSSSHPAAAGAPGAGGGPAGRCAAMSAAQAAHITGARGDAGGAGGGWGVWAVCVFHGAWDAAAGLAARVQLALVDAAAALRHGPQAVSEPASPAAAAQAGVAAVFVVAAQALWSVGVVAGALVLSMSCAALCCEGCEFAVELVLSEGAWLRRVVGRRGAARRLANGSRAEAWQLMMYFWVSLLVRWVTGVGFWPLAGAMLAAGLVAELLR